MVAAKSIKTAHDQLLVLGRIIVEFARVERAPRYPDGRRETDVEHSFHLALSAAELAKTLYPKLDVGLVAQFGLIHDFPEVYAGDVWTFHITKAELAKKKLAEKKATEKLLKELPPHTAQLLKRYEEQVEPEARFVRFIDKLLPAVINIVADKANTFEEDYGVMNAKELRKKRSEHTAMLRQMFPEFDEFQDLTVMVWETSIERLFGKSAA